METTNKNTLLLRIAIAFAFLYPPIDSIFNPDSWVSFFPRSFQMHFSDQTLLLAWGVLEVIIALWILSGKKIFIPSVAATVLLFAVVAFNLVFIEIVFRDLSLAFVSATLAWWSYKK